MNTTMKVSLHGIVVETPWPIAAAPSAAQPDIQVTVVAATGMDLSSAGHGQPFAQTVDDDGAVTMLVRSTNSGSRIEWPGFASASFERRPAGSPATLHFMPQSPLANQVVPVLVSPGVGVVAMLAGALVLHATAVVIGGHAVLLLADRGGGKSSVAALLGSAGVPLLAEDVCALTIDAVGNPVVHSGIQELRLRTTTPWLADLPGLVRSGVHPDGRVVVSPPVAAERSAPLGSVIIVRLARSAQEVAVTPLSGVQAVKVLMDSQRCAPIVAGRMASHAFDVAAACARTEMAVVTIPWAEERRNQELGVQLAEALRQTFV